MAFTHAVPCPGPLRQMSECMFHLEDRRSGDWTRMRPLVEGALTETGHEILAEAQASSPRFEAFFAGFARATLKESVS